MRREYRLSDSAGKKHIAHFMKLLAIAAVMAVVALVVGLKRWSSAQYVWVIMLLLSMGVFCINVRARFGGRFDGKENQAQAKKKFLIVSSAVAAGIWLLLVIMGQSVMMVISVFLFIADVILTVSLGKQTWEMLKNMWKMAGSNTKDNGSKITYPGEFVLHDVHISDALTSPFGKILIHQNAVLFVLPEMNNGFVMVNPNGTMELKKTSLIKNEVKENNLSVSTIMRQAEEGAKRVMQLVEAACKKNQIPVPEFNYDFVLFLPNFDPRNTIWDQSAFEQLTSVHFWNADKKYEKYENRAINADYFEGKACYKASELHQMLRIMAAQSAAPVDQSSTEIIAAEIAKVCELEPIV